MTENVSWYLVISLRTFHETLAVSSPSGWSISPAMSIRSRPVVHTAESDSSDSDQSCQSQRVPPAVKSFPDPETTTTLQTGSSAISLKHSTISLQENQNFPQRPEPGTPLKSSGPQSLHLQKALFMALRFSGRCSSTCVTASVGRLTASVVKEAGPPADDMVLHAT